ncbi:hypothetical protein BSK59_14025 [Paenibacillus odorifer]|uniref:hypothetical protein n=1 Tax=Paenibacillus odorifer TaxID=189426 RepID=UPI00096D7F9D|nr:hypothetical protein [Paenibacillus odorifer]OME55586.1 hypothetical protein BSK59_14025 [Paenibacillus odorifer]
MKFPARYTFSLSRNIATGEQKVSCVETNNQTVKIENIKYSDVRHHSWNPDIRVALLGCGTYGSEEELKKAFELYSVWDIESTPAPKEGE